MRILKISICLLLIILLTSCVSVVWVHRDFDSIKDTIKTIAIMPPQFEYFERSGSSINPKPERNSEVSDTVSTALNRALQKAGFTVSPSGLTDSVLTNNQDLSQCLIRSNKKISEICDSIDKSKIKKESYKMDPEIKVFADRVHVDYLLFSLGTVVKPPSGFAALFDGSPGVAVGIGNLSLSVSEKLPKDKDGMIIKLVLVDANTSEAIWHSRTSGPQDVDPFDFKHLKSLCRELLRSLST